MLAFALWCSYQVEQTLVFWLAACKLCLKTYPLLPIAVFHIINPSVIPLNSDSQQARRPEPILCHDYKIGEETSKGLDHTWTDKKDDKTDEATVQCNCNRNKFPGNPNNLKNYSLWHFVSQAAATEIVHTNITLSCNLLPEQLLLPTLYSYFCSALCCDGMVLKDTR